MQCASDLTNQKRPFWTLQKCQPSENCGILCSEFGLTMTDGRLNTFNGIQSLAMMILLTDGENNDQCIPSYAPRGGHWSQSFTGNTKYGSSLRRIKSGKSIQDNISLIRSAVVSDLGKLIVYGVATEVDAEILYLGGSQYSINIIIIGPSGRYKFNNNAVLTETELLWK